MENGRKAPIEKTRAEMRADKMKVWRRKQGDEKENENRSGDGSRGRESERESERSAENGMNECQTCIFRF